VSDTGQQPSGRRGQRLEVHSVSLPRERAQQLNNKDWVRGALAFALWFLLFLEVSGALAFIFYAKPTDDKTIALAKDIMVLVLNPTVALVGAATGFYYGGSEAGRSQTTGRSQTAR
jgi:hypothetical protein